MRNLALSFVIIFLFTHAPTYACRPGWISHRYLLKENSIEFKGNDKPFDIGPVNKARFRNLDGNNFDTTTQSWWGRGYFTDDEFIFFNGRRLVSPLGPVDATKFNSLGGEDATFRPLEGYMSDGVSIFKNGKFVASANKFEWLAIYMDHPESCSESVLAIARNHQSVFMDEIQLPEADPTSFTIIRWVPDIILEYRDKRGDHVYTYAHSLETALSMAKRESDDYQLIGNIRAYSMSRPRR